MINNASKALAAAEYNGRDIQNMDYAALHTLENNLFAALTANEMPLTERDAALQLRLQVIEAKQAITAPMEAADAAQAIEHARSEVARARASGNGIPYAEQRLFGLENVARIERGEAPLAYMTADEVERANAADAEHQEFIKSLD